MNKFRLYFIVTITSIVLFSCSKNNNDYTPEVLRDYGTQSAADNASIENYLKKHYLTTTTSNGEIDIAIDTLKDETHQSMWDNTDFPLKSMEVYNDTRYSTATTEVLADTHKYKMYYLILNEGGGTNPTTIDSVFTTYKGWTFDNKQTTVIDGKNVFHLIDKEFDSNDNPFWSTYSYDNSYELSLLSGYRQFLTKLKTASSSTIDPNTGALKFNNSGIGVVFIPSGLGYFNNIQTNIAAYTPVIFRIRLHTLKTRDHDGDHVKSVIEDKNNNGNYYDDDTDGDTLPDFLDRDDDGDGILTKNEVIKNADGSITFPDCDKDNIPDYLDKDICK